MKRTLIDQSKGESLKKKCILLVHPAISFSSPFILLSRFSFSLSSESILGERSRTVARIKRDKFTRGVSCVEPLGHAAGGGGGGGGPSSDLQVAGGSSRNFKDTKDQLSGRPPPLTRAVSWMVEEKKISEEKDEDEEDEENEEEKKEARDGKEEERGKLLPPTLIPGPPRSSRQASVDRGSMGMRSRQGSVDSRDPVDPKLVRRGPDGEQRGSRKGSVDRATGTDPERSPVQAGSNRIEIEPMRESSSPRTDPEYYRRGTNQAAGGPETERIRLRQDFESRRGRPPVRQMSNLETGRAGTMMTRSSSIESSSSEIMKIRNLVSIRRGSIDRGMATEVKPVKLPEAPSSVQTPVSAKAPSETLRRDGLRGRLGRGGSLSAEPRPRGRGGAVLRRNFSMDQGGGVVQVQQRQQQPQPQQQQFAEGGVVVRQRPPAPAPPTRRSYPSASFNNKKYPSITITGPAAVKNRSPSPRGRELLAAVNEIHEQMKRRDKEETGENSETEEKDETEDEFHENQFEKTRRPKGQRACSSPSSNSNAQLASRTLTNGPVHICIRSLRSCDLTSSI